MKMKVKGVTVRFPGTERHVIFLQVEITMEKTIVTPPPGVTTTMTIIPDEESPGVIEALKREGFGTPWRYLFCWIPSATLPNQLYADANESGLNLEADYPEIRPVFAEVFLNWDAVPDGAEVWVEPPELPEEDYWQITEVIAPEER